MRHPLSGRIGKDAWAKLGRDIGAAHASSRWHERLLAAYAESARRYHNEEHLAECLDVFDRLREFAMRPAVVECALWFHDAVYDPRASDNEERSAALALAFLRESEVGEEVQAEVRQLILATKTHLAGDSADAGVVLDSDLAILGQPPERFWRYETAIAAEYAWVEAPVYREKRREVLERFLSRLKIYHTPYALQHYEAVARDNLRAANEKLRQL